MKTNRINLQISEIPKRYFYISVLVLLITVISVIATGYFFRFADQYTDTGMITNKDIQDDILRTNANDQFFKHLQPQGSIRIYLLNGKSKFLGYGRMNKSADGQFALIKIENKVQKILDQKFKSVDTIGVMLQYNGPQKSIFRRILQDQKQSQTANEKPINK